MDLQLTDKEAKALEDMLQHYREFQEEVYNHPDDPDSLFTEAQRRIFARFGVISIRQHS